MDRLKDGLRRIFVNTSIEHFRKAVKNTTLTEIHRSGTIEDKAWNALG